MTVLEVFSEKNLWFFVGIIGFFFGSFFNVCIRRIPEEKTIVWGRSHCPQCAATIRWWQNIPILSYLLLLGRCYSCQQKISWQYPIVELLTGVFFMLLFWKDGLGLPLVFHLVLFSYLLVITFIDLEHMIIPDGLNYSGMGLGFLASLFLGEWWDSLIGLILGFSLFAFIAVVYEKMTKREGLGGGDVKMLGMLGAWFGYQSLLPIIILSTSLGSLIGVGIMVSSKKGLKTAIPFGPFLAVAALIYLFFGETIQQFIFPEFRS